MNLKIHSGIIAKRPALKFEFIEGDLEEATTTPLDFPLLSSRDNTLKVTAESSIDHQSFSDNNTTIST